MHQTRITELQLCNEAFSLTKNTEHQSLVMANGSVNFTTRSKTVLPVYLELCTYNVQFVVRSILLY